MTSSTKPEVHNMLHCRQKRTQPRHRYCTEKFCEIWICRFWDVQADRHTDTLVAILRIPTSGEVITW